MGPLLTCAVHESMRRAIAAGRASVECSLDLKRSMSTVPLDEAGFSWEGRRYPYLERSKDHTVYYWAGDGFSPVARYTDALVKLVPTDWGPPTFEIDGIKMLPTAHGCPYADAERKVSLVAPRGKRVLDTCGGLGYFAAWCLSGGALEIQSYEKNTDVLWLRGLNPWSPAGQSALRLTVGDIAREIRQLPDSSVDAVLHDPPRIGIAGELYAQAFYDELSRVLVRRGRLFHYTGAPNKLTTGRDVPREVAARLKRSGFRTTVVGDGILGVKT